MIRSVARAASRATRAPPASRTGLNALQNSSRIAPASSSIASSSRPISSLPSTSSRASTLLSTSRSLTTRPNPPFNFSRASFHSSGPRSNGGGKRYTRFGGQTSSGGGIFENLAARFSDPQSRNLITLVVGLGGGYYVYHLERIPESGRWRFIDVSKAAERQAGLETFQEIMQQYQSKILPPNHKLSRYVQGVAERIVSSADLGHVKGYHHSPSSTSADSNPFSSLFGAPPPDVFDPDTSRHPSSSASLKGDGIVAENEEWEVFVIKEDETRNAFVLPGGKIFVFTGILPVAKTEDGLASVLGHEIAHTVARHGGERMSGAKVIFGLMILLDILGLDFGTGLNRLGLSLLLTLPNSRTQESEADAIGLNLMSKACFDPREAAQMWVRMEQSENPSSDPQSQEGTGVFAWFRALFSRGSVGNVDFLSTHPASGKRIKAMEQRLPEALALRAASPGCARELGGEYDAFRRYANEQQGDVWA